MLFENLLDVYAELDKGNELELELTAKFFELQNMFSVSDNITASMQLLTCETLTEQQFNMFVTTGNVQSLYPQVSSVEGLDAKVACCLEGLGSALKTAWDKIVAAVKWIIEKLTDFGKWILGIREKLVSSLDELDERIHKGDKLRFDRVLGIGGYGIPLLSRTIMNAHDRKIASVLSYLEKIPDITKVLDGVTDAHDMLELHKDDVRLANETRNRYYTTLEQAGYDKQSLLHLVQQAKAFVSKSGTLEKLESDIEKRIPEAQSMLRKAFDLANKSSTDVPQEGKRTAIQLHARMKDALTVLRARLEMTKTVVYHITVFVKGVVRIGALALADSRTVRYAY